jgi:hypothetical protein
MQQREFNFAAFLRSSQYITLMARQPTITDKIPSLAGFSEIHSRFFQDCGLPQILRGVGILQARDDGWPQFSSL